MGEEFLRKQNEQFKHGRDRAYKELSQKDLLTSRPEFVGRAFPCVADHPANTPTSGTTLILNASDAGLILMAADGPIGMVRESEAQHLRDLLAANPSCQKMMEVRVHETVDFLGEFTVRVAEESEE